MLCPNCHSGILREKDGEYICSQCGLISQDKSEQSKAKYYNPKYYTKLSAIKLISGWTEVIGPAFGTLLILAFFQFAVAKWILYEDAYYSLFSNFSVFFILKVLFVAIIHLLLVKRILYQIKFQKFNLGKIFHWKSVKRGILLFTRLLLVNIIPCALIVGIGVRIIGNDPNYFNFIGSLLYIIMAEFIFLFLLFLNFILIEYEKKLFDSIDFTLELLEGYKIKLLLLDFALTIVAGSIYNNMVKILMYKPQDQITIITTIFSIVCFNLMFLFHLGFYYQIKSAKQNNSFFLRNSIY